MCRLKSASLALLVSIFACSARVRSGAPHHVDPTVTEIQVRVSYSNERRVGQQIQVDLLNAQGVLVGQTFTDSEGQATFHIIRRGRLSSAGFRAGH